ncbi:hypothetical protein [Streptomyces sp. NPDC097640]|uniref:hypothetical protein n=1 Tax=Streptomyces sp. NPDC097640 TaxID=3157229 RepID=UPI00332CA54C
MIKVSAIPENLFRYSDACTQGAEQMQTWVRNVLTPALQAYENGGGPCTAQALDVDVAKQVAAAYYTDRKARTVGMAFLRAGGVLVRGRNHPIFSNNKDIDKAFKRLQTEAAHQGQINAGAALARGLPTVMDADERQRIERELAKHADDPYFTAGFFNSLNLRQLEQFLAQSPNIKPFVSAYASGVLSDTTTANFVETLSRLQGRDNSPEHNHITAEQQIALLNALARNPAASANFANSLTAAQIRHLIHGEASLNPPLRTTLLGVLTTAMENIGGQPGAHALMGKVSQALFAPDAPGLTKTDLDQLLPSLTLFFSAGVNQSVTPPEKLGANDLRKWSGDLGTLIGKELRPFMAAIEQVDLNAKNSVIKLLIDRVFVKVLFKVVGPATPQGLVATLAYRAAMMAVQKLVLKHNPLDLILNKLLPDGKYKNTSVINDKIAAGGLVLSVSALISQGLVHHVDGGKVRFTGNPEIDSQTIATVLENPLQYYASKPNSKERILPTIKDLMNEFTLSETGEAGTPPKAPETQPGS